MHRAREVGSTRRVHGKGELVPGEGARQTGHSKGCRDPTEDRTQESRPPRVGHEDSPPRTEKTQRNAAPTARQGVTPRGTQAIATVFFISGLPSHFV